jgi:hypothetical protein
MQVVYELRYFSIPRLGIVSTSRYVLLPLANLLTGYSVKAMNGVIGRKARSGSAPDGRILIDVLGYQRWVESSKTPTALHSRGLEGKKTSLPMQMNLALKREKETKSNGKTKS